jgi:hypothetical protein
MNSCTDCIVVKTENRAIELGFVNGMRTNDSGVAKAKIGTMIGLG